MIKIIIYHIEHKNQRSLRYTLRSPRLCGKLMKNQPQRRNDAKGKISTQNSLFKNVVKKGTHIIMMVMISAD